MIYNSTGTCFDDVIEVILYLSMENKWPLNQRILFIVHGIHISTKGEKVSHAWIEYKGRCYDMKLDEQGEKVIIDYFRNDFYKELKVIDKTRYRLKEIRELVAIHGDTTGPWEQKYKELCKI